jgi:Tol biopolymer transport system component
MVPTQLTWFDRGGHALDAVGEAAPYESLSLSSDAHHVAVALRTGKRDDHDIWVIDIGRSLRSRLTVEPGTNGWPVWSPDGKRIVFESWRPGKVFLRQRYIDGTAADESLLEGAGFLRPSSWSSDGRFIAYTSLGSFPFKSDIWALPLFGDRKPFPLIQSAFTENSGVFSPDGRWIAFVSDEAGQPNVYVQGFPVAGRKYPISKDGGSDPVWRSDGRELFYLGADRTLMAARINAASQFDAGVPQALFPTGAAPVNNAQGFESQGYAVTKDGERLRK